MIWQHSCLYLSKKKRMLQDGKSSGVMTRRHAERSSKTSMCGKWQLTVGTGNGNTTTAHGLQCVCVDHEASVFFLGSCNLKQLHYCRCHRQRGLICLLFGRRQETFLHWAWAHALCKCSNGELKTMANVVCIGFFFLLWLFSFCEMFTHWLEETLWGQISGALFSI